MAKRKFNKGGEVRLVAYYRYSGGSGQTEQSIEGQRRDCEAYARLHNMAIQKEYVDRHISGKTDDRAAFQQMIADSDKGAFDMVICWKTDRFARNRYDSAVYKKRLRDNGVEIVYAAESNISGAEGIIIEGVMEALAEYYSAELAEKMRRGMRESALKGQAISRCRALGLKTDEHKRFVLEHNLDLIKCADHIIDLGPEGGSAGGEIVAEGTPEQVAEVPGSFTGQYLKPLLEKDKLLQEKEQNK